MITVLRTLHWLNWQSQQFIHLNVQNNYLWVRPVRVSDRHEYIVYIRSLLVYDKNDIKSKILSITIYIGALIWNCAKVTAAVLSTPHHTTPHYTVFFEPISIQNQVHKPHIGPCDVDQVSSYIALLLPRFDHHNTSTNVVFTRRYRPADGPGLCPVSIDVSGVFPLYVRGMSDVCPLDGESRTQRRTVRRTEGVAIIARGVMTYYSDDVVTE